jgi:coenzyme F420 hydrogenase subunit beta
MRGAIETGMGIPLEDIKKFNVKGKVLIYKRDGEVVEMNLREAQEYARPECHHCGDFSAELADISCGGVGAMDWTITVLRTRRGEDLFNQAVADGVFETQPIEEFENSMKVLLRLARKQRWRVPLPLGRAESFVRAPGFSNPH